MLLLAWFVGLEARVSLAAGLNVAARRSPPLVAVPKPLCVVLRSFQVYDHWPLLDRALLLLVPGLSGSPLRLAVLAHPFSVLVGRCSILELQQS